MKRRCGRAIHLAALAALLAARLPACADTAAAHPADWLRDARLGAFMHFWANQSNEMALVGAFDAPALAKQLKKMGAPCQYGVHYIGTEGRSPKLDFVFVQEKPYHVQELREAGTTSSRFRKVLDFPYIRDVCVIRGPDAKYYLVGTPKLHGTQEGIHLFRSDSHRGPFEHVGTPWTFAASTWANTTNFGQPNPRDTNFADRIIWAPEIEYIKSLRKWVLVYFPNKAPRPLKHGFHIGIAASDTPLGPYKDLVDGPIATDPDPHLFEDDDGTVYLTSGNGRIARMKPDLSGLAEAPRLIYPRNAHAIANEGTTLFKHEGVYYFGGAFSNHYWDDQGKWSQTYDCVLCASTNGIYGPYGTAMSR